MHPITSAGHSGNTDRADVLQPSTELLCLAGSFSGSNKVAPSSSISQWYVTYYFTNVPDMIPCFCVKEAFEVCGILDNLFLSRKRNKQDHIYGFVRFANVRDSDKLLRALNNVTIGQFRVWAKVARFDRKPLEVTGKRVVKVIGEEGVTLQRVAGKEVMPLGEGEKMIVTVEGDKSELVGKTTSAGGLKAEGRVQVNGSMADAQLTKRTINVNMEDIGGVNSVPKLVRMYRSHPDDLLWARKGVVAAVLNGEVIPVIQTRIADAGFDDLDIILLGANKVFIRYISNADVM